jgi:hypothetical protein
MELFQFCFVIAALGLMGQCDGVSRLRSGNHQESGEAKDSRLGRRNADEGE